MRAVARRCARSAAPAARRSSCCSSSSPTKQPTETKAKEEGADAEPEDSHRQLQNGQQDVDSEAEEGGDDDKHDKVTK